MKSSYEIKKEKVERYKRRIVNPDHVKNLTKAAGSDAIREMTNIALAVQDKLTPAFVKRIRFKRQAVIKIAEADELVDDIREEVGVTIENDIQDFKERKQFTKKLRKKMVKEKAGNDLLNSKLEEVKEEEAKAEFDDWRERHRLIQLEAENKEKEKEQLRIEKLEKETDDRRNFRQTYWSKQAKLLHAEAVTSRADQKRAHHKRATHAIQSIYDEWQDREIARAQLQVKTDTTDDPIIFPSGKQLGIYGTSLEDGAYSSLTNGGPVGGLDQYDIELFSSQPQTDFELQELEHIDTTADMMREQALYDSLSEDVRRLDFGMERMCQMRDIAERDLFQVNQELLVMEKDQLGPPRRLPIASEVASTAVRRDKVIMLKNRISELQHSIDVANSRKCVAESQCLTLAKSLAILREKSKEQNNELNSINDGLGMLPMVIGRNISTVPGLDATAKPLETYNAMTQASKITLYKDMSVAVRKVHREGVVLERNLWVARMSDSETRYDVERTVTKLADISLRLQQALVNNVKANLVGAIDGFMKSDLKLNITKKQLSGLLSWFKNIKPSKCTNIDPYTSIGTSRTGALGEICFEDIVKVTTTQDITSDSSTSTASISTINPIGVALGSANFGVCIGIIPFPKVSLWRVFFTVAVKLESSASIMDESSSVSSDKHDYCTIYLGPSLDCLVKIGVYFNIRNSDGSPVVYDVKHFIRGNFMAYKFEFSSSSLDPNQHFAVNPGQYEEYQMQDLEFNDDPNAAGPQRVLSSYVKLLRIEEKQGKLRITKLLEELIRAEASDQEVWESKIIQGFLQTYNRLVFLRILRAEILVEQRILKASLEKDSLSQIDSDGNTTDITSAMDISVQQVLKIKISQEEFLKRKRRLEQPKIKKAAEEIGKRLDIYDSIQDKWRHVYVLNIGIRWIDNGMKAKIYHILQEFDDNNIKIGGIFQWDISNMKYFDSPTFLADDEAIRRHQINKKREEDLSEIDIDLTSQITMSREEYTVYKAEEETSLQKTADELWTQMSTTLDEDASSAVTQKSAKEGLKNVIKQVMEEIEAGLITREPEKKLKIQAREIALERYMADWKQKRQRQVQQQIELQTVSVETNVKDKYKSLLKKEEELRIAAEKRRKKLLTEIRAAREEEKARLLKQVKFDSKTFEKAVIKGDMCQHLKSKAWGDKYGKGVRCCNCNKELTELEKEESQVLGYGTGADPEIVEAITRHRKNEAAFKFKDSNQLKRIEEERVILEKERRVMQEEEIFFYDFQDIKAIYKFDRRHAQDFKDMKIFRQGVQWKEEEFKELEANAAKEEELRCIAAGVVPSTDVGQFDALQNVELPPPTLRAMDLRREAQYDQLMYSMGRLGNFHKRISELKEERVDLLTEKAVYSDVLAFMHRNLFILNDEVDRLEVDLERTGKLYSAYVTMKDLYKKALDMQELAKMTLKKCEMRRCGVWEAVAETKKKFDIAHEETKSLLRFKFAHDLEVENRNDVATEKRKVVQGKEKIMKEVEAFSTRLLYCQPGAMAITKYGLCRVRMYRAHDDTVIVTLNFGNPPAKAWIPAIEIISRDRARQQSELILMGVEDILTNKVMMSERIAIKRELYLMQLEDVGMRDFDAMMALAEYESKLITQRVTTAVNDAYVIMKSKQFKALHNAKVPAEVEAKVVKYNDTIKNWKGRRLETPEPLNSWTMYLLRTKVHRELKNRFLEEVASKALKNTRAEVESERMRRMQSIIHEVLLSQVTKEVLLEIAQESIHEGRVAKHIAETTSGIYFPDPIWMQYGPYCRLQNIWKERKMELRTLIEMSLSANKRRENAANKDVDVEEKDLVRELEEKRKRLAEKKRQKLLNDEMAFEEARARAFYKAELLDNLRERRLMRLEEQATRQYDKELELRKKAAQSKYNVSHFTLQEEEMNSTMSAYERRRYELKLLALERRKIAEDLVLMAEEDRLSELLRIMDRAERQRKAYLAEFGMGDDEEEEEDLSHMLDNPYVQGKKVVPPAWLKKPSNWIDLSMEDQLKYINMMEKWRNKDINKQKNILRDIRRMAAAENKSFNEWKDLFETRCFGYWNAELEYMEAVEERNEADYQVRELKENISRLVLFCQKQGDVELRIRSKLREQEALARRRDKELLDSQKWVMLCEQRVKDRKRLRIMAEKNCLWIDTDSMAGYHQRFRTEILRDCLYKFFFHKMVLSLVNRAELIATERRLMRVQDLLSMNRTSLYSKSIEMRKLWKKIQRDELLRMKRSALSNIKKVFPHTRRKVLAETFGSWVRFHHWNRGHREAFTLKYEVLKRQLDIDRQFKEQLLPKESEKKKEKLKISQKLRERPVHCRNCKLFYLEAQNHSMICKYHSGSFIMQCPRSCPNPGQTPVCISHKRRRWTCCDSTVQICVGCSRRYHIPDESDPVYDKIMEKINERDMHLFADLDSKLLIARKEDWPRKALETNKGQVIIMEDVLEKDRSTVSRYKNLKFV